MSKMPAALASGTTTPPGTGAWHRLSLAVAGARLVGSVDGVMVGAASDGALGNGLAGVGTGGYQAVQFDDLDIEGSPASVDDGGARADAGSPPADAGGLVEGLAPRDARPEAPQPEPSAGFAADSGGTGGGPTPPPPAGGCSCRSAGAGPPAIPAVVAVLVASSRRRRRR